MHSITLKPKTWVVAFVLASAIILNESPAHASPVVLNPSFELDPSASANQVTDWTSNANTSGLASVRGTDSFVAATDGTHSLELVPNVVTLEGQTTDLFVSQNTGYLVVTGDTITLRVDALQETAATGPGNVLGTIALTLNGIPIVYNTSNGTPVTPLTASYYTSNEVTASFTVSSAQAGGVLGIELIEANKITSYGFDDVRLSVVPAPTPEPSTWAMMIGGLLALIGWRRVRRTV